MEQSGATNSAELNVVKAEPNFPDTKSWEAGDELGPAVKEEAREKQTRKKAFADKSSTPLFLKDSPEGNKGNAQDEKDQREE